MKNTKNVKKTDKINKINKINKRKIGEQVETLVCSYLKSQGYIILEKNFKSHFGEIDIIARENEYIVFMEVKYRKNVACGYPLEAVNYDKQQKIIKTSLYYIQQNHISLNASYRYDVVSVLNNKVSVLKNAFTI